MSLQVIAEKVSVYEITGNNEFGQPVAIDHVYQRGQVLPDWVDGHQAFVLVNTGLAAEVGDHPDGNLRPLGQQPGPVLLPEHNPATVPGSGVIGPMVVTERVDETGQAGPQQGVPQGGVQSLPDDSALKPVWEQYAAEKLPAEFRMDRGAAESMKKSELVAEVKARYNDAVSAEHDDADLVDDEQLPRQF